MPANNICNHRAANIFRVAPVLYNQRGGYIPKKVVVCFHMSRSEQPSNEQIAAILDEIAGLLENVESNPYRVQAFRTGAQTVREADQPIAELARRGDRKGLMDLPGIGEGWQA